MGLVMGPVQDALEPPRGARPDVPLIGTRIADLRHVVDEAPAGSVEGKVPLFR